MKPSFSIPIILTKVFWLRTFTAETGAQSGTRSWVQNLEITSAKREASFDGDRGLARRWRLTDCVTINLSPRSETKGIL